MNNNTIPLLMTFLTNESRAKCPCNSVTVNNPTTTETNNTPNQIECSNNR